MMGLSTQWLKRLKKQKSNQTKRRAKLAFLFLVKTNQKSRNDDLLSHESIQQPLKRDILAGSA
jgi:hypothetical protein